jgi:hypothetical protein
MLESDTTEFIYKSLCSIGGVVEKISRHWWEPYFGDDWCYYDDTTANRKSFHYGLVAFGEYWMDEFDPEDGYLPDVVYRCDREYPQIYPAESIASGLMEDFICDLEGVTRHARHSAENLWDWALEDLYTNPDDDSPDPEDPIGLQDLQAAIDIFKAWNNLLFMALWNRRWFNPGKHCVGLWVLRRAVAKLNANNQANFVYDVNYENKVILDRAFWLQFFDSGELADTKFCEVPPC